MESPNDEVHELLAAIVATLNNCLYDLSVESDRDGKKVVAKRLDFSRQKVMSAWEAYNQKRAGK